MISKKGQTRLKIRLLYTLTVAVVLIAILVTALSYVYIAAERDGMDSLHTQTKEFKDDLTLQIISDRENLYTMSLFASKLYREGEDLRLIVESFKPIGLIDNIGLLLPDETLITKVGTLDVSEFLSFEEEATKGEHITGRVMDFTNADRELVRSAVPVISDGKTVAILYGAIGLDTLEERYLNSADAVKAQLYVFERGNGKFLINTRSQVLGNISELSERDYREGYSYEQFYNNVKSGQSGFTSFVSKYTGDLLYLHYSPLEIADWTIMLAEPDYNVFSEAQKMGNYIFLTFVLVVLVMFVYIAVVFASESRQSKINYQASQIRKQLLGINNQVDNISEALKQIATFSKSRSSFFVDTDGEDFNYVLQQFTNKILTGADKRYFVSFLFDYAQKQRDERRVTVGFVKISTNIMLKKEYPEFYNFLKNNEISNVSFTWITNNNYSITILGTVNPKNISGTREILLDVAVCFSMAIYNKKHLEQTETIAVTDALTGLSNRVAYKKDILSFNQSMSEQFSCVYIDVNELHVVNNKFGHSVGDGMLVFIANTLTEVFCDNSHIYRIGGDEFLVFVENTPKEKVEECITELHGKVEAMNYHVSTGLDWRTKNIDTENMVLEAEKRMYEAKAEYYQRKELKLRQEDEEKVEIISTGIREIDAILSVMKEHYLGIYCVNLDNDSARQVLMPSYLKPYSENEDEFSKIYVRFVEDKVDPDYHRPMLNFLQYSVIRRQILEGKNPSVTYSKINGGRYRLTVYPTSIENDEVVETLWIFEKLN